MNAPTRSTQLAEASGGWLWLEKEAIDRILLRTGIAEVGSVIAVYVGLCRLSSDRQNATEIKAGKGLLAKLSGVSTRTVQRATAALENIGLIRSQKRKLGPKNDENTYFLLACCLGKTVKKGRDILSVETLSSQDNTSVETDIAPFPVSHLKEMKRKAASNPAVSDEASSSGCEPSNENEEPELTEEEQLGQEEQERQERKKRLAKIAAKNYQHRLTKIAEYEREQADEDAQANEEGRYPNILHPDLPDLKKAAADYEAELAQNSPVS